jgi:protein ImuB
VPPFACLFVPDFPTQAVVRLDPELRKKAVGVFEGAPPLTKVFSANRMARATGVEIGMTKLEAESCLDVVWRWRSRSAESTAHAALLDCAWTISPRVADRVRGDEDGRSGAVALDIGGCERLFGTSEKIASDLKRVAESIGLAANVAIAGNAEAAICAAQGFSGITVIPDGSERSRLGPLPLSSLDMPSDLLGTLKRWGIHTCEQLALLPEIEIVERLGQQGRHWHLLARGSEPTPLLPMEPPVQFEEYADLEFPVDLLEPLMFLLNRLLIQLCTRLSMHVLAASEIQLTLTLQKNRLRENKPEAHVRTLRLPVPARESPFLLKLLQLDLQNHPPNAAVVAVKVVAIPARSRTGQMGLFLPLSPEPERLEITLARIRNTVGDDRVGAPVLLNTHRPGAFEQKPFVLPDTKAQEGLPQGTQAALRIYRPPLPVSVALDGGKPTSVRYEGTSHNVLALAGPWRTKGDWWSATAWARDEWDVLLRTLRPTYPTDSNEEEKDETALYRIYRDLRLRLWFVEGIYD